MLAGLFSTSVAQAPEAFPVQKGTVEFRQASKSYGDHRVLNAIDLQVAAGEVIAVCGPSGSGKSTLIRLINQLETLTSGEAQSEWTDSLFAEATLALERYLSLYLEDPG